MVNKWSNLNNREKIIVSYGSLLLFVVILFFFIIQPNNNKKVKLDKTHNNYLSQIKKMELMLSTFAGTTDAKQILTKYIKQESKEQNKLVIETIPMPVDTARQILSLIYLKGRVKITPESESNLVSIWFKQN